MLDPPEKSTYEEKKLAHGETFWTYEKKTFDPPEKNLANKKVILTHEKKKFDLREKFLTHQKKVSRQESKKLTHEGTDPRKYANTRPMRFSRSPNGEVIQ